jgi:hypothetical protein
MVVSRVKKITSPLHTAKHTLNPGPTVVTVHSAGPRGFLDKVFYLTMLQRLSYPSRSIFLTLNIFHMNTLILYIT